jgi:hypothetical protein
MIVIVTRYYNVELGLLDLDQKDTVLDISSRSIVTTDRKGEQIPSWPSP